MDITETTHSLLLTPEELMQQDTADHLERHCEIFNAVVYLRYPQSYQGFVNPEKFQFKIMARPWSLSAINDIISAYPQFMLVETMATHGHKCCCTFKLNALWLSQIK